MEQTKAMEELRATLGSPGWQFVIFPTLQKTLITDVDTLTSPKRPEGLTDDYLRGRIESIKSVLRDFGLRLTEHDNRIREEAQLKAQAVAADQTVGSPYAPDTDNPSS